MPSRRDIAAGLSVAIPLVCLYRHPALVFIGGGHSLEAAMTDYRSWSGHLVPGGLLAIHDIFPDPADGGQAPYTIYRLALASGLYEELPRVETLGLLRRIA